MTSLMQVVSGKKESPPKPHQQELVGGDKISELDT